MPKQRTSDPSISHITIPVRMSTEATNLVSRVRLRPALKAVLNQLAWFANPDGENIFPSVLTLSERTGYSRRAVQKILRELEQQGAIQAVGSRLGGRHRTTRYRLVVAWCQANREAEKGERRDSERANGSARKGERDSPEQKEHEYEQKQKPVAFKREEPPALPYEQQRLQQRYKSAMRKKAFPTPAARNQLNDRRMEARRKLAEFEKRRSHRNDEP